MKKFFSVQVGSEVKCKYTLLLLLRVRLPLPPRPPPQFPLSLPRLHLTLEFELRSCEENKNEELGRKGHCLLFAFISIGPYPVQDTCVLLTFRSFRVQWQKCTVLFLLDFYTQKIHATMARADCKGLRSCQVSHCFEFVKSSLA